MLPIVHRELRVQCRRPALFGARIGASVVATGAGTLILFSLFHSSNPASGGRGVFAVLLWLCFLFCLWEGFRTAAAVLAKERDEGTLGLLFLTDLRGYDVVLGKLAAVSIRSLHGLLAFFPILAVTLLMGGVSLIQFVMSVVHLLATLFFSVSLSLWVSAGRRTASEAQRLAFGMLFLTQVVPLVLYWTSVGQNPSLREFFQAISGAQTTVLLATSDVSVGAVIGWPITCLLAGVVLLARASWMLPSTWQASTLVQRVSSPRKAEARRAKIAPMLDSNPVTWLAFRERSSDSGTVIFGILLLLALGSVFSGSIGLTYVVLRLALLTLLFQVASTVSRQADALKSLGSLELILATPLNLTMMVSGLERGFIRRFRPEFLALIVTGLLSIGAEAAFESFSSFDARFSHWSAAMAGTMLAILSAALDSLAVGYLAAYQGIKRDATAAFSRCVGLMLFQILPIFCIPNLVVDLVVIISCSSNLAREIRRQAEGSARYRPESEPWWARLIASFGLGQR